MNKSRWMFGLGLLLLASGFFACQGEKQNVTEKKFPLATIPNTEVRELASSFTDQVYRIFVGLPLGYTTSEKTYPTLYVFDANGSFGMVTEIVRTIQITRELPQMLIVGIGYPVDSFEASWGLRTRDLCPTENDKFWANWDASMKFMLEDAPEKPEFIGSGGGPDFLQFIRKDLIPFVESSYRVDPKDRAIFGDSLGGLYSLYVLFHHPDTFSRYIVGSPSMWWDEEVTFTYESDYAAKNSDLKANVFIGVGALEEPPPAASFRMVTNVGKLEKILQERNYPSLKLATHIFPDETHVSVPPAILSRGAKVVFGTFVSATPKK